MGNKHVSVIVKKASERLYFSTQLRHSKVGIKELVQFLQIVYLTNR
jgi:hypothetical protein